MPLPLPRGRLKASETIRFTLDVVFIPESNPRPVVLLLRYAGRSNAALVNASAKAPAAAANGSAAEQANAGDLRLAELYAKHVVVGWDDVTADDGTPIAYTPALGEELLKFLILEEERPDIFRTLAYAANSAELFVPKRVDPDAVGKR